MLILLCDVSRAINAGVRSQEVYKIRVYTFTEVAVDVLFLALKNIAVECPEEHLSSRLMCYCNVDVCSAD